MQVGSNGKKLLIELEGLKTEAYEDSGGAPTIGVGHLLTLDERRSGIIRIGSNDFNYLGGLTEQQCCDLLDQDIRWAKDAVNREVKVILNQNQFDALVLFVFNVGAGAFRSSTLLKLLNQGKYDQIPTQLRRWTKDNGRVIQGLVNRREKEIRLWEMPA
jgi:lysozyme